MTDININCHICNTVHELMMIDIRNSESLHDQICGILMSSIPGLKCTSLLTYNKQTNEIVYRAIAIATGLYDKSKITDLVRGEITLKVSKSSSGRLISSADSIMIVEDVLEDKDYQSIDLARYLGLKRAIFLKLIDLMTQETRGVLIIYPYETSPANQLTNRDFEIVAWSLESVLSNSRRVHENKVLGEILEAAKKVKKDLSSFLQKSAEIISCDLGAKGCSIFVIDPADDLLKLKGTLGVRPGPALQPAPKTFTRKDVFYRLGEGTTGTIAQTGEVFLGLSVDTSKSKWIEKEMSKTFLGMPILKIDGKSPIGVVRCATRPNTLLDSTIEAFDHGDIARLEYITRVLSVFIELSFYQASQKELITKMPHEMRASLANIVSICNYLMLIYEKAKTNNIYLKNFDMKLKDIMDECKLSLMTVNSMSAFEDSKEAYEFESIDIFTDIVAKVRKMLNPIAHAERNIAIVYKKNIMPRIYIDRYRMQLVFHNLLINAIKYSDECIKKEPCPNITIEDGISNDNKYYAIAISNYGIGIPDEKKEDVFLNGVRTAEAIAKDPTGKGFGLALVKQIIKQHCSRIEVTSLNQPTTFTAYFPIELADKRPTELVSGE